MRTAFIKFHLILATLTGAFSSALLAKGGAAGFQKVSGVGDTLGWSNAAKFTAIPFDESLAFCGDVDSAAGDVLSVIGAFWKINQFVYDSVDQPRHYAVEIVTGTSAGSRFDITANSGNTLTVNLDGGTLSGISSGDEIRVYSKWTFDLLFPVGGVLTASTAATVGSEILLPSGVPGAVDFTTVSTYHYRSDLNRWIDADFPAVDVGSMVIPRDALIVIKQSAVNPIQPVFAGSAASGGVPIYVTVSYGLPEITVEQPLSTNLVDGVATVDFGEVAESSSSQLNFTIRNSGTFPLIGLSAVVSGNDSSDFALGSIGATALNPGEITSFAIQFQPGATGDRSTSLAITSNDADENPFDVTLTGSSLSGVTLESWAESFGLSGDSLLSTADDDGDGVSLIMEYAFNLDPTVRSGQVLIPESGTSGLPLISFDGDHLRIEMIRRIGDSSLVIDPQFSGGLGSDEFSTASVTIEYIDTDYERVVAVDALTTASALRRFARVLVTEVP